MFEREIRFLSRLAFFASARYKGTRSFFRTREYATIYRRREYAKCARQCLHSLIAVIQTHDRRLSMPWEQNV